MSTINSFSNILVITTKFDEILLPHNAQKMKFSIKDFFSKYDEIRSVLRIWSYTEENLNGKLHFLCSDRKKLV